MRDNLPLNVRKACLVGTGGRPEPGIRFLSSRRLSGNLILVSTPALRESDSRSGPADAWNAIPYSSNSESGMGFPIGAVRRAEWDSQSGRSGRRNGIPNRGGQDGGMQFPVWWRGQRNEIPDPGYWGGGMRFRLPVIAIAERDSNYERSGQRDETSVKRTNPWWITRKAEANPSRLC